MEIRKVIQMLEGVENNSKNTEVKIKVWDFSINAPQVREIFDIQLSDENPEICLLITDQSVF